MKFIEINSFSLCQLKNAILKNAQSKISYMNMGIQKYYNVSFFSHYHKRDKWLFSNVYSLLCLL